VGWWDRYVWRRTENRQELTLEQLLADEGRPTASGEPVTVDSALRLSTVWACVRLLADSVSTLPLHVYRGDDRDPIPTPALLQRPSADFPELADWLWAIMASLLLRGNAWGLITDRRGAGLLPSQVDLVHPDRVAITTNGDGQRIIRVGGVEQNPADIFHCKAFPWPGQLEGLSPIAYARESIGLGLASERYGAKFFNSADLPIGFLSTPHDVDQKTADTLRALWHQLAHGHPDRVGWWDRGKRDIAILGSGATFKPLAIAPEEAQFIGTQKFSVSTIARFYGVPPEMVAGETAGHEAYTSPEMRGTDFLTFSLRPWLYRIERAISGLLPSTQKARFNAGAMVRATLLDRYTAHKLGIEAGWLLPSEVRELEDRPPVPGIDDREPPRPEGGAAA
jgi:HK97 family phage portal protein